MIKAIHFFADTIAICCVNTSKLHMHLECNYFVYIYIYIRFSYIVHTIMERVACKSPMPLQAQVLYIFPAYAMVLFQVLMCNSSLLKILVDHKSWQIPRALPFPPCFRKGVFLHIPW